MCVCFAALVLVWNFVSARILGGEEAGCREYVSTLIIVFGTVIAVVFADHVSVAYTLKDINALWGEWHLILYGIVVVVFIFVHFALLQIIVIFRLSKEGGHNANLWMRVECISYGGCAG